MVCWTWTQARRAGFKQPCFKVRILFMALMHWSCMHAFIHAFIHSYYSWEPALCQALSLVQWEPMNKNKSVVELGKKVTQHHTNAWIITHCKMYQEGVVRGPGLGGGEAWLGKNSSRTGPQGTQHSLLRKHPVVWGPPGERVALFWGSRVPGLSGQELAGAEGAGRAFCNPPCSPPSWVLDKICKGWGAEAWDLGTRENQD